MGIVTLSISGGKIDTSGFNGNSISAKWVKVGCYVTGSSYQQTVNMSISPGGSDSYTARWINSGHTYADCNIPYTPTTNGHSVSVGGAGTIGNSARLEVTSITAESPRDIRLTSGKKIYEPISFSFAMTSSNYCELEVWQNDYLVYSKTLYTTRNFTIPAGTLKTTQSATIKLRSTVSTAGISATSSWVTYSLSGLEGLVASKPTSIEITGESVINKQITFGVAIDNTRDLVDFELYQNEELKYSKTGSSPRTFTITPNTLTSTQNVKARARTQITVAGISATSDWLEVDITGLEDNAPRIYSLEPNNIDVNGTGQIKVNWVSQYQEEYILSVKQDNNEILKYSGATEKEVTIPPYILTLNSYVDLQLYIVNKTLHMTDSKSSRFYAYGRPDKPILDYETVYNTARPTFTWQSAEQTSYQVQVLDSNYEKLEDSGEVVSSTSKSYSCKMVLTNETYYYVQCRVKNKYGLWSEWEIKAFYVVYAEIAKPNFNLQKDNLRGTITLVITNASDQNFASCEVYRKKSTEKEWVRIGYNFPQNYSLIDYSIASNTIYDYKVRALDKEGGISDSVVKSDSILVKDFQFINVSDYTKNVTLNSNPKISYNVINNVVSTLYAGNSKPTLEKGKELYKTMSMSFEVEFEELEAFQRLVLESDVLIFRDRRKSFMYGNVISNIEVEYIEGINLFRVNFVFSELSFSSADIYEVATMVYSDGENVFNARVLRGGENERA